MRRDVNIRKRKKIFSKNNKNTLIILSILTFILFICFAIYSILFRNSFTKNDFETHGVNFVNLNQNIPFSIEKLTLFSSATAESNSINQQLTLDISQYSDIVIYLDKTTNENTTISSLYIDNIIMNSPEIGTPYLYKKSINDLGKCSFNEENIIDDTFQFNIIDTNEDINYNNFEIYNNASTPISLGFYNKNIKLNFFPNRSELIYNGTLLKDAFIPTNSLDCNISFKINITTNSNEHYICNITVDIPFEDEHGSIYDNGYVTKNIENRKINNFIRIK